MSRLTDLIHNLPFFKPKEWNSDYFYRIESLSYIEQISDVQRIKNLLLLVADLQNLL